MVLSKINIKLENFGLLLYERLLVRFFLKEMDAPQIEKPEVKKVEGNIEGNIEDNTVVYQPWLMEIALAQQGFLFYPGEIGGGGGGNIID